MKKVITLRKIQVKMKNFRSSRPEVFYKKGAVRIFTKFTGKYLCQSLFLNKVAGLRTATLLKKRLWHRCFPVNFVKSLRTPLMAASGTSLHYFQPFQFEPVQKKTCDKKITKTKLKK